ncbi:hypothetical protein FNV43_RR19004 [Rhamnella rubrinervis]|uniref:Ubiquitin-conjugating enzyme E2C-binding protein n=1 Tax=Rhamnella rubrinervis TaxID=2594499 RepID=A0A8K0E680_9ROSA|nr:hypothetical protein FNV43_RR19004 [Rhamnella rubrinervis]
MSRELGSGENPRKWRFTWEAQSHIPTLRLFLFDSCTKPSTQCQNLNVNVSLKQSLVLVTWCQDTQVSLRVPIPRVLVDSESPVSFRALEDHIEVKLVLLLPVDHPIVSSFDSILNLSDDVETTFSDASVGLSVDSDIKSLSSCGGVDFYCRNCSVKLTSSPLRNFMEMPSVNWREVADNWFGACCCSFGGISEKLVTRFVNSHTCAKGICLLSSTTITLCKDDIVGCNFPDLGGCQRYKAEPDFIDDNEVGASTLTSGSNHALDEKSTSTKFKDKEFAANYDGEVTGEENNQDHFSNTSSEPDFPVKVALVQVSESDFPAKVELAQGCCTHHVSETFSENQKPNKDMEILDNQKSFLNGYLGNIFMVRSSNLSVDVEWIEFLCPQCSSLLGAYPCSNNDFTPVDGGVRLFKCYVSTSLPVGGSRDVFRGQFRTRAKDGSTTYHQGALFRMLQKYGISNKDQEQNSLLNSNNFENKQTMEDWVEKDLADEVFMPRNQILELVETLESAKDILPPSYSSFQGLSLSSIEKIVVS